jgi:hypothetical protein
MTVRLLKPYAGRPVNAVTSALDASTEAGLIAAGQATTDLAGGIKYFVPRPDLAIQPKVVAVGSISLKMEEQARCTLPEGQVLLITGAAGAVGEATRAGSADKWAIAAGALPQIGPFAGTQKILITCTTGGVDAVVQDAVLTQVGTGPLPIATSAQLGGIKSGPGLGIDPSTGAALPAPSPVGQPYTPATEKRLRIRDDFPVGAYRGDTSWALRICHLEYNRIKTVMRAPISNTVTIEVGISTGLNHDSQVPAFTLQIKPGQKLTVDFETQQIFCRQASATLVADQMLIVNREYMI